VSEPVFLQEFLRPFSRWLSAPDVSEIAVNGPGQVWVERLTGHFHRAVWLNPVPQKHWGYTHSITLMRRLFGERMFPLTLQGLEGAMRLLSK